MASGHVLPAAYRQLALLSKAGGGRAIKGALDKMDASVEALTTRVAELQAAAERAAGEHEHEARAKALADQVFPAMAAVREVCDRIEESVADEFWTLPKYREMLSLI